MGDGRHRIEWFLLDEQNDQHLAIVGAWGVWAVVVGWWWAGGGQVVGRARAVYVTESESESYSSCSSCSSRLDLSNW